jgi:hypothetical protein
MRLPEIPGCETVVVVGPVSSGKTFLARQWLKSAPIVSERSITIDTAAQFMEPEYFHSWGNPKLVAQRLAENPHYYRVVYHPVGNRMDGTFDEEFYWCVNSIWAVDNPRFLIIEEVHEVCGINSIHPSMSMAMRYSRHRDRLGVIGTTQRLAEVNKTFTEAARMAVIFRTEEPVSLDAISRRFGIPLQSILDLRPLIQNDVTKTVEQTPQCLVWLRGQGHKVYDLGDKVKTNTGEDDKWQEQEEEDLPEVQPEPTAVPFSEQPSGKPEQK